MLGPGEVDELVGHEPVAHGEGRAAVAMAEAEDEGLQRPPALATGQRGVHAKSIARDRAGDHLERVARSGPSEGGLDDDLATLARRVGLEQGQGALQHLEGVGRSARRARTVVAHDVREREADVLAAVDDLDRVGHMRQRGRRAAGRSGAPAGANHRARSRADVLKLALRQLGA